MPDIVGVRFKRAGRVYYFDPAGIELHLDDKVVVETTRGSEIGRVVIAPKQVLESELQEPLRPVLRRAMPEDLRQIETFRTKEHDALRKCGEKVAQHGLPMKLVSAEYNFDGSRLTFYFTAEGRVDFRELVKDLGATFRTRIELRQIGVRDEAKMLGGLGRCGRQLCCASFLGDFAPVSIRMAKEQDLPLNPMKISGVCGRLLCCLGYENETYCQAKLKLPRTGEEVETPQGHGKVVGVNILKDAVTVELESKTTIEVPACQLTRREPAHKPPQPNLQKQHAKKS
ncbi:MAG: stage 0 sporulation family protein [Chloroflexi bacterium]|nr:stage 0 sporulation family protein [Chloroflexota bacterium]